MKISDITSSDKYVNQASEFITEDGIKNSSAKIMPKGTILYTIFATIGEVGILNFDSSCNQAIAGINTFYKKINEYLYLFLVNLQDYMKSISKGCAQFNINQKILKEVYVALPPHEEQQRIVKKIEFLTPCINQYEKVENELFELDSTIKEKLKKSILQYAIQGKLVKQDPNDEPASVLLERIKSEKEQLIKEGKIKRDKNESVIYQGDDKNYYEKIVDKWVIARLVDVGYITGGGTPKTDVHEFWNGNIVWVTPADMSNKVKYIKNSRKKISIKGLEQSSAQIVESNSIIISSRAPIGYISINTLPITTSQGCKSFTRFSNNVLTVEWGYYYLLSNVDNLQKRGTGTTFKEISGKEFGFTKILIPPTQEQKRIVNKLKNISRIIDL